jgi:hypothetical protein
MILILSMFSVRLLCSLRVKSFLLSFLYSAVQLATVNCHL